MGEEKEQRFDSVLLGLAQQHEGGVPDLMDTIFGFLRRKTDFYSGGAPGQAKNVVTNAFHRHDAIVQEQLQKEKAAEKKRASQKRKEQKEREKRELEEKEKEKAEQQSGIVEITPEEEQKILKEIEEQKHQEQDEEAPIKENKVEQPMEVDEDKVAPGKVKPNSGNGWSCDKYVWTQTLSEVDIRFPIPQGTVKRQLDIVLTKTHVKIGLKGEPPLVSGEFHKPIKVGDSFWELENNRFVNFTITKSNQMDWWPMLLKGDPELDTQKVNPEPGKLEDLDGETRGIVEKMMFDQRQKQMGLPTSDEIQKNNILGKFMSQHPEMDFSKAKFSS